MKYTGLLNHDRGTSTHEHSAGVRALCTILAQCHHSGDELVQNTSWKDLPARCAALTVSALGETSSKTWFMETSVQQLASQIRGAFFFFFFLQTNIDWSQLLWSLVALHSPCEALKQHLCRAVSHDTQLPILIWAHVRASPASPHWKSWQLST